MSKLEELMSEKTIFLFWAWSSLDYNFPDWNCLKLEFKRILVDQITDPNSVLSKYEDIDIKDVEAILKILNESNETLDQIVSYKKSKKYIRIFKYCAWLSLVEQEARDVLNTKEWRIEKFADLISEIVESKIKNWDNPEKFIKSWLKVITLNYERLFVTRFINKISKSLGHLIPEDDDEISILENISDLKSYFNSIHYIHWSLWKINDLPFFIQQLNVCYEKPDFNSLAYWDVKNFNSMFLSKKTFPLIYPINILTIKQQTKKNPAYKWANSAMRFARNLFICWISKEWLENSHIDFSWWWLKNIYILSSSWNNKYEDTSKINFEWKNVEIIKGWMNEFVNYLGVKKIINKIDFIWNI